jgi:type IV pilus assembly protein PilC
LEESIVTAAGRSGRLDRACDQLARYFEALVRARSEIRGGITYPVVMLHLTLIIMNIQVFFSDGVTRYLWSIVQPLAILYGALVVIWLGWRALADAARSNVAVDEVLRKIPCVGPIREKFALARFFATLDGQLEAAVNIWDAFANAARTSDSARIISAARQAMPMLQSGERLSEVLGAKKILPAEYVRSFRVAEQAGELDAELTAMALRSEELAVAALKRWSEWLPRMIYAAVLFYGGWRIVAWYADYMGQVGKMLNQ